MSIDLVNDSTNSSSGLQFEMVTNMIYPTSGLIFAFIAMGK